MTADPPEGSKLTAAAGPAANVGRYTAAWLAGALPAFAAITLLWLRPTATAAWGDLALGSFAIVFPVMVRRLGVPRDTGFVDFLLVVGLSFGVVSILTGWANGLTDEPFTTPRFAWFTLAGHNPYTTQMVFSYQQYGQTLPSSSHYVYLPLLMFLQFPGLDYKWFTLTCWALMVLLARHRFDTAQFLAQPYVLLVAASGYNDLPVLLLLTLGFVGLQGRRRKWAEYLALGCKQFANALVILYYLVQRRWRDTAITLAVSASFLVPFVLWGGPSVLCPSVFADRLPSCAGAAQAGVLLNYPVWAVWVLAVFYLPASERLGRWSRRAAGGSATLRSRLDPARWHTVPASVVVAASGGFVGLCGFESLTAFGTGGLWAAAAVGAAAAGVWAVAWDPATGPVKGPDAPERPDPLGNVGRWVVVAGVAMAVFALGSTLGLAPLTAESVGLGVAALAGLAGRLWPLWPRHAVHVEGAAP